MKAFLKVLSLILAMLLFVTCFVACGGEKETAPEETDTETDAPKETEKLDEFGRPWIDDSVPTDANYANEEKNTVTFFVRSGNQSRQYELDVDELADDTLYDAIYNRNATVEARLGVVITTIAQDCASGSQASLWNETLRNAVNTKSGDFDGAALYASQGSPMALEGCYYNLLKIEALDLEKPWWNQDMIEGMEFFDTLFFLGGSLLITEPMEAGALLFNKALLEKHHPTVNLYNEVNNLEWTIDRLYDLSSSVWEDVNTSGIIDDGDVVGFAGYGTAANTGYNDLWQASMGVKIIEKAENGIPELTLYSERTVSAYEKVSRLHIANAGALGAPTANTKIALGNVLFQAGRLGSTESLREMTDPYGVLPLPMYDKEQGRYYTASHAGCSILGVLASIEKDRLDMVGNTIELMGAESYRQVVPKYYEVCLKSKYSADVEDAMIYDLIIDSIIFDVGMVFGSKSIGGVNALFRDLTIDFAQKYESNKTSYETALEKFIDSLDEIAFTLENAEE